MVHSSSFLSNGNAYGRAERVANHFIVRVGSLRADATRRLLTL
jgi:hypothetical protein